MGYTKSAISGFSWHSALKVGAMAATLLKISVLARLLTPEDFGLFSLIVIALGLTEAATQTGVNVTIINSKRNVSYFISSAWVIAIIRGFLMGIVMLIIGLLMSRYYDEPQLAFLIALTALVPAIKGFINPSIVGMQKELKFFQDSLYRFSLIAIDVALAIVFGLMLKSVTAMILAMIGAAVFEVLISFIFFKDKPAFQYIHSRGKVILSNARGLSVTAALSYIHENVDDFIIGKIAGTHNLGLYHNAYSLSHKANYELAKAVQHSTFPVYAKINQDAVRLQRAFIKSAVGALVFVGLTSLPLLIFTEEIVLLILGDQWLSVIPLVPWLVMAGIIQSFTMIAYNLFLTKERYLVMNLHLLMTIILLVAFLLWFVPDMGIMGGAMAVAYSRLLTLPVIIVATIRLLRSR